MLEDDDEDEFTSMYENGHWKWNEYTQSLEFVSELTNADKEAYKKPIPNLIGAIDFKDDLDVIEQQRFRKRFQRKTSEGDIVTLQDIKDIVLFTAPKRFVTPNVVHMFHLTVTQRFIRALILYFQYFLQILEEMNKRVKEEQRKIPIPISNEVEKEFSENLQDIRLIIAKEYATLLTGSGEFAKFHHMGKSKKSFSLSNKDAVLFEMLIRMSTQLVWLALGRKSYNQIDVEFNRMFRSDIYNSAEHKLGAELRDNLSSKVLSVLYGQCMKINKKLNSNSPILNEMYCDRDIDYQLLGVGVLKHERLDNRLQYLESALIAPEALLSELGLTLGIIGLPRSHFDTMLREIKIPINISQTSGGSKSHSSKLLATKRNSRVSTTSVRKSTLETDKLYPDIHLPERGKIKISLPSEFPLKHHNRLSCDIVQRNKWLNYASRMSKHTVKRHKQ